MIYDSGGPIGGALYAFRQSAFAANLQGRADADAVGRTLLISLRELPEGDAQDSRVFGPFRWGQVPVLLDGVHVHLQSAAIVEHLAEVLGRFQGADKATRQSVREWLYWDVDALFPPVFGCYGVQLGQRKLLPIDVEPAIADYHRRRAEAGMAVLNAHLASSEYLCAQEPTIADLFCYGDVAFAEVCAFDLERWANIISWAQRLKSLPGFKAPFDLLTMEDAEFT